VHFDYIPKSLAMSPGILARDPTFTVTPMTKTQKEKHNFGAVIEGVDLENISGKAIAAEYAE
jgi:hypothetical protein